MFKMWKSWVLEDSSSIFLSLPDRSIDGEDRGKKYSRNLLPEEKKTTQQLPFSSDYLDH